MKDPVNRLELASWGMQKVIAKGSENPPLIIVNIHLFPSPGNGKFTRCFLFKKKNPQQIHL